MRMLVSPLVVPGLLRGRAPRTRCRPRLTPPDPSERGSGAKNAGAPRGLVDKHVEDDGDQEDQPLHRAHPGAGEPRSDQARPRSSR